MATLPSLGIKRLEGIHYYVHDLERSRRFYTGLLDFAETWRSGPDLERAGLQRSACFSELSQVLQEALDETITAKDIQKAVS